MLNTDTMLDRVPCGKANMVGRRGNKPPSAFAVLLMVGIAVMVAVIGYVAILGFSKEPNGSVKPTWQAGQGADIDGV
jgi:hypothetical protein